MDTTPDKNYPVRLAAASIYIAKKIIDFERNSEKQQKMRCVLEKKIQSFNESFNKFIFQLNPEGLVKRMRPASDSDLTLLFIDLLFSDPFAPYEISYKEEHLYSALKDLAALFRCDPTRIDKIVESKKLAGEAHNKIAWGKILLYGTGGLIVMALGGWVAAPYIGASIGAAAGLTGAAAAGHGLAILGGGSLALGGLGMAGGMGVVTGLVGLGGGIVMGGGQLLIQIGAAQAKIELLKLQVNYKEILLSTQSQTKKAQKVISNLEKNLQELRNELNCEKKLNDENSQRIRDVEKKVEMLENALEWIKQQKAA